MPVKINIKGKYIYTRVYFTTINTEVQINLLLVDIDLLYMAN